MAAGAYRPTTGKTRTTKRTYVLSGRVHCGLCGHRMQGNMNHDAQHYRCKFASDRALPRPRPPEERLRPRVRQRAEARRMDRPALDPANLDATCDALPAAGGATDADHARIEAAKRKIEAAIDASRPSVPTSTLEAIRWLSLAGCPRSRSSACGPSGRSPWRSLSGTFTKKQIRELVAALGEVTEALAEADPKLKAQVYEELGIIVTYDPTRRVARIESRPATPWATVSVGGPDYANSDWRIRPMDLGR